MTPIPRLQGEKYVSGGEQHETPSIPTPENKQKKFKQLGSVASAMMAEIPADEYIATGSKQRSMVGKFMHKETGTQVLAKT